MLAFVLCGLPWHMGEWTQAFLLLPLIPLLLVGLNKGRKR